MPTFHPPRALTTPTREPLPILDAPGDMVARFLELHEEKRRIEDQLAFLRGELEMAAASALHDEMPRGRFVAPNGQLGARLYPTATFDRAEVGESLQRLGRLSEVAALSGPSLARFVMREPQVAARLKGLVRLRKGIMLVPGP